jgi:hypothetical protein
MEILRIYIINNRNSELLYVSCLGVLRIHNRYRQ